MYLQRLKLSNFKNYREVDVAFSPRINCLVGNNGVGKTNLLDAIYYLSFCKSFLNPYDAQNVRHGEEYFAIHGEYRVDEATVPTSCVYRSGHGKQMKYNKKAAVAFAEHIGRLPLVVVSPADQVLISGGSEVRRKFMDGVISQVDHAYLQQLLQYQKALEQRNTLLRNFYDNRYFDDDGIALWDEQLAHLAQPIHVRRQAFVQELAPLFLRYFKQIAQQADEQPELIYLSQLHSEVPMLQQLVDSHRRDAMLTYTSVGVHKDDLELRIDGYAAKKFGSQGQQKTFLLALKLAQYDYIKRYCNRPPLLLLDDIFDKLDMLRVRQLLALVGSDCFGQTFVTDTQPGRVEAIFAGHADESTAEPAPVHAVDHKIFRVESGGTIVEIATAPAMAEMLASPPAEALEE